MERKAAYIFHCCPVDLSGYTLISVLFTDKAIKEITISRIQYVTLACAKAVQSQHCCGQLSPVASDPHNELWAFLVAVFSCRLPWMCITCVFCPDTVTTHGSFFALPVQSPSGPLPYCIPAMQTFPTHFPTSFIRSLLPIQAQVGVQLDQLRVPCHTYFPCPHSQIWSLGILPLPPSLPTQLNIITAGYPTQFHLCSLHHQQI